VILQNRFEEPENAHHIVTKGPEALQSQFSAGYGMVLNLLHTRTQEEAKVFIQRSFSNYLGREQLHCLYCIHACSDLPRTSVTGRPESSQVAF
jgi:superfamily II RNA helicase